MPPAPGGNPLDWINPQNITVISVLVFFIVGLMQKWWVMGYQLTDMKVEREEARSERDEWKTMALKNFALAERSTKEALSGTSVGKVT